MFCTAYTFVVNCWRLAAAAVIYSYHLIKTQYLNVCLTHLITSNLALALISRCCAFSTYVCTQTTRSTAGIEHKWNRRAVCGDSGTVPWPGPRSIFTPLRHHHTAHAWYVRACVVWMCVRVCVLCMCVRMILFLILNCNWRNERDVTAMSMDVWSSWHTCTPLYCTDT